MYFLRCLRGECARRCVPELRRRVSAAPGAASGVAGEISGFGRAGAERAWRLSAAHCLSSERVPPWTEVAALCQPAARLSGKDIRSEENSRTDVWSEGGRRRRARRGGRV